MLGVSILDERARRASRTSTSLTFRCSPIADHEVAEKYGVWQKKSLYGRSYMGIARTTYLIVATAKWRSAGTT